MQFYSSNMIVPKKRNSLQLNAQILRIRSPRHLRTTVYMDAEEPSAEAMLAKILQEVV